jgi:hypothetical protein
MARSSAMIQCVRRYSGKDVGPVLDIRPVPAKWKLIRGESEPALGCIPELFELPAL